jgi:hypothetical protein
MGLAEAIAISRTFSLDKLIQNFRDSRGRVVVWRSAEEALAVCPDRQTMPRLLELLDQELMELGDSSWFSPIELRLRNRTLPKSETELAVTALFSHVTRKGNNSAGESVAAKALNALAGAHPLPVEVVEFCGRKLGRRDSSIVHSALQVLLNLDPAERERWIPDLLKRVRGRLSRANCSEGPWIIERVVPHFTRHRKQIVPVLREGLKSKHTFTPRAVLSVLHELGSTAAALVPDVLAYISRQRAFTNEEAHLIRIDPHGTRAVPGLIRLLASPKETVRYQAACELEAYGPRARAAIPALVTLASRGSSKKLAFDADAAQRALDAIRQLPNTGGKKSATTRALDLVEKAVNEE